MTWKLLWPSLVVSLLLAACSGSSNKALVVPVKLPVTPVRPSGVAVPLPSPVHSPLALSYCQRVALDGYRLFAEAASQTEVTFIGQPTTAFDGDQYRCSTDRIVDKANEPHTAAYHTRLHDCMTAANDLHAVADDYLSSLGATPSQQQTPAIRRAILDARARWSTCFPGAQVPDELRNSSPTP